MGNNLSLKSRGLPLFLFPNFLSFQIEFRCSDWKVRFKAGTKFTVKRCQTLLKERERERNRERESEREREREREREIINSSMLRERKTVR